MKKTVKIVLTVALMLAIIVIIGCNALCLNHNHRDVYPVNPICPKCGQHDGIVAHTCSNPDGKDKYCSVCGKIVLFK